MKTVLLFALLFVTTTSLAAIRPADGLWNTTDDPEIGSGLMFATQGDITLVSVFTYDEEGKNVWYIGSGQVDENGVLEVELVTTTNGSYLTQTDPSAAELDGTSHQMVVEFTGSQIGTLSIDESDSKIITASHYGVGAIYDHPILTGVWVLGSQETGESYILDLEPYPYINPPIAVIRIVSSYKSNHHSTNGWAINCLNSDVCFVNRGNSGSGQMKISLNDLRNQRMTLYQNETEPFEKYEAFRLNEDRRLLPADGYWRTHDDPAIGSGLVMRTQGGYTVVLVYSYNDEGQATWQIASGQFDENGLMEADLYTPSGGSPVNSVDVTTGQVAEPRNIAIQLQGTNLGTVSIDAGPEKSIQAFVYGLEVFETHHKTIGGESYQFPDQKGSWVIVDEQHQASEMVKLRPFDLNAYQSPPDPRLYDARQYEDDSSNDDLSLKFFCTKVLSVGSMDFMVKPYCYGSLFVRPSYGPLKLYYEDIGAAEFRFYTSETFNGLDVTHINRDSNMFYLFKLSND